MSRSQLPSQGESSRPRSSVGRHDDSIRRQKILVLGWRKAGKTSCIKTVFEHVPPSEVAYFDSTQKFEKIDYDTIIPLQIWDTPSNFELETLDVPLSSFSTIIYVMDIQADDSYHEAMLPFVRILLRAYLSNPAVKFAVFIHKAESLSEDYRGENYAEIQRALAEELEDFPYTSLQQYSSLNFSDPSVTNIIINSIQSEVRFDMTSVHDVSLREAWSRVLQGIMEMLPSVESLLINFTGSSGMDNTYLFDMESRVVVASDNRGRNDATMQLVTEYLDKFLQFADLYKCLGKRKDDGEDLENGDMSNGRDNGVPDDDEEEDEPGSWWDQEDPDAPWMTQSTKLMPNTTIALWQFTPHLVLVILVRTDTWQTRRGMIEYNLTFLRQGVRRILMEVEA
ncbi:Gtr1/RagA G protein conserved region-domain-containing protein [Kockovaella imperatae]|uniref:GTP-binding protein n=1 Tax=Kockovaella imperatae TaxID=4999 RepID=A0A1Y1U806_9TREE|nr:Gtr1/RagA G protein conserved region-domain-containing protein [Kockovaella imperatae]ORX34143.1 Gtr1/RagA G protein conserved region-domain-containing protein [Kockovaella imperatae]